MSDIATIMKKQEELEAKFQRHLNDYAMDRDNINDGIAELHKTMALVLEQLTPITQVFSGSKFTGNLIVGILKFLAILGAGIAALFYLSSIGIINKN